MEVLDVRGQASAVRQCPDNLWLTVFWGEPAAADVALVVDSWERAIELRAPYRSLVDARHVRRVDPRAIDTWLTGTLAHGTLAAPDLAWALKRPHPAIRLCFAADEALGAAARG
jgi:hypothetical protein